MNKEPWPEELPDGFPIFSTDMEKILGDFIVIRGVRDADTIISLSKRCEKNTQRDVVMLGAILQTVLPFESFKGLANYMQQTVAVQESIEQAIQNKSKNRRKRIPLFEDDEEPGDRPEPPIVGD
jgi:hypothetical protein